LRSHQSAGLAVQQRPLGTEVKDAQGREVRGVIEPKEIAEFKETIMPRDHRVFFGALDPQ